MRDWCLEHYVEQGSPEWLALRLGKITGSRANKLFARTSRGWAKSREHMVARLAMERLRGRACQGGGGAQQARGHENEPLARAAYELAMMCEVETVGFLTVRDHPAEGVSPDGLVGDDGAVEIKVPTALEKHVGYLTTDAFLEEYGPQLRHTLYVTGRQWIDAVSYYPEAGPNLQLWTKRFTRASLKLADYPEEIAECWAEIDAKASELAVIQRRVAEAA